MSEADIISLAESAVWTSLKMSAPMLIAALVVGLIISLFQALTQIQEMTLVFVPKIVVVFLTFLASLNFFGDSLSTLTRTSLALVAY